MKSSASSSPRTSNLATKAMRTLKESRTAGVAAAVVGAAVTAAAAAAIVKKVRGSAAKKKSSAKKRSAKAPSRAGKSKRATAKSGA